MKKLNSIVFLIVFLISLNSLGQDVKNVRVTQEGKTVVLIYDLTGKSGNYNVNLFYTLDDGKSWQGPLKNVTGDVLSQIPGKNKKAVWNAADEKGQLEGNIQFKLNAEMNKQQEQSLNNPIEEPVTKPEYSPEYYKYKKSKTIWLTGALVSSAVGVFSMIQANNYYNQYQTATTDAADLHQKVELYDKITPIAFVVAGLCTVEFIIKSGKQNKAKKQTLGFYPQPIKDGVGLGFVCKF